MQTILMMAELEGHSFWLCDSSDNNYFKHTLLPIEMLPLSFELNNQITEWVAFYDENFNVFTRGFPIEVYYNFDILGKQLWQLVKEELKDKYKVVYYSEVEQEVLDD